MNADLRTAAGRSTSERKALKQFRRAFIEKRPNFPSQELAELMTEAGLCSRKTALCDCICLIERTRRQIILTKNNSGA